MTPAPDVTPAAAAAPSAAEPTDDAQAKLFEAFLLRAGMSMAQQVLANGQEVAAEIAADEDG